MTFETFDGRFFSLLVEEYEFPDEELGPTEDNPAEDFETDRFLIVSHSFRNSDGEWRARGPTMTNVELQRFSDWLEAIRDGNVSTNGVYFTERDLEFTVDNARAKLNVHVSYDFLLGLIPQIRLRLPFRLHVSISPPYLDLCEIN